VHNALIEKNYINRDDQWTQSIAVGSKFFTEKVKTDLGYRAKGRFVIENGDIFRVCEEIAEFENNYIDNTFEWVD